MGRPGGSGGGNTQLAGPALRNEGAHGRGVGRGQSDRGLAQGAIWSSLAARATLNESVEARSGNFIRKAAGVGSSEIRMYEYERVQRYIIVPHIATSGYLIPPHRNKYNQ